MRLFSKDKKIKSLLNGFFLVIVLGLAYFFISRGLINPEALRIREIDREFKVDFSKISEDPDLILEKQEKLFEFKELALSDKPEDQLKGWLGLGGFKKDTFDYKGAERAWLEAGEVYPGTYLAFCNLAGLYNFFTDEPELAVENYEKCINNFKTNIDAYQDLANLYVKLGDFEKAEKTLEQGFASNKNDPNLLIFAAYFYKEQGHKEKAIEYFEKAIEALPDRVEYYQQEIDELNSVSNFLLDIDGEVFEVEAEDREEITAYDILKKHVEKEGIKLLTKQYDFGIFIEGIGDKVGDTDSFWLFYVNGELANASVDNTWVKPGDIIRFEFTR